MFKKLLSWALAFVMVMGIGTNAFASDEAIEGTEAQALDYSEKLENLTWHDFKDIESIEKEDTYTYTELVEYLTSAGFAEDEIKNLIGPRPKETRATEVRYGMFYLTNYTYSSIYILEPRISVGLEYTVGQSSPNRIVEIGSPHIFTGKGAACKFAGTINYKLTAGNSFYYLFYGDLYKAGAVSATGGASVNIGPVGTISFEISSGDGYITNVSRDITYYSAALQP